MSDPQEQYSWCVHSLTLCLNSHPSINNLAILNALVHVHGVFITVKKLSVKHWTLLTLNGRNLGLVAEGEGPLKL